MKHDGLAATRVHQARGQVGSGQETNGLVRVLPLAEALSWRPAGDVCAGRGRDASAAAAADLSGPINCDLLSFALFGLEFVLRSCNGQERAVLQTGRAHQYSCGRARAPGWACAPPAQLGTSGARQMQAQMAWPSAKVGQTRGSSRLFAA